MEFYNQILEILQNARLTTYRQINSTMIQTYWLIGQQIVEEEQNGQHRAEYGKNLIGYLSDRLTQDFGKGYRKTNLKYMRLFYLTFPIRHALRDELSWTHYRLLLKFQNEKAKIFYFWKFYCKIILVDVLHTSPIAYEYLLNQFD